MQITVFLGTVIGRDKAARLVYRNFSFDILAGSFSKIFRCLQPVNILKTDGCSPNLGLLFLAGFSLAEILVKT